VQNTGQD